MNTTRIKVETIAYYHRDRDMKVTLDLLPKELNENKKYIDNPNLEFPFLNLETDVKNSEVSEMKIESLLEYICQRPWKNEDKPDFVTNKHLLKCITSSDYDSIKVHAFRMSGVIFMWKTSDNRNYKINFGAVFGHFLTGLTENFDDEIIENSRSVRKAVFGAKIPMDSEDNGRVFKVLYSGEVDAIDTSHDIHHYEFKVILSGLNFFFWKENSCWSYWQAVFGNAPTTIVGSRTGKYPSNVNVNTVSEPQWMKCSPNSIYKIETLHTDDIPSETIKAAKHPKNKYYKDVPPFRRKPDWTVQDCEKTIQELLKLVNETMKNNGDCFIFSKTNGDDQWIITEDKEKIDPFCGCVVDCLNKINQVS